MTFKETILQEALELFHKEGINQIQEPELLQKLDISSATFREMFDNKEDLLKQMAFFDLELQKDRNAKQAMKSKNAIEELFMRIQTGITNLQQINPLFYMDLMEHYPEAWQIYLNNLDINTKAELSEILNRGVIEGHFRKDINIQLVVKIMLEQVTMLVNPQIFPPDRYNLAEVFRSIFLYYIRGICSEAGAKMADEHFSRISLS
jgi:AcrR family transcriptional regulator